MTPQVVLDRDELVVTLDDIGLPVVVCDAVGRKVVVNGIRRGRQARSLARYW